MAWGMKDAAKEVKKGPKDEMKKVFGKVVKGAKAPKASRAIAGKKESQKKAVVKVKAY